jgi:uncharacterized protein with GYD domain
MDFAGASRRQQGPARLDAARQAYESAGIRMPYFWMVTGQYDMIGQLCDCDQHRN